jgi:hypothetical protein
MPSQGPEDAILARIFDAIGTTNRYAVEFGARDGVRLSNTHALRLQGWTCLLLDANPVAKIVRRAFLTAENINATFARYAVPADFDLLSIDVDGNDFYLWQALSGYRPRVVVIEYNCRFGPDQSVVIAYRPDFIWDRSNYYGASAAALVKLGAEKGYVLADVSPRINLVFVRADLGIAARAIPPAEPCPHPARLRGRVMLPPRQWVTV